MLQVFLHMAVVRLKGQVMGYLTPDIGIIEVRTHFFSSNFRGKPVSDLVELLKIFCAVFSFFRKGPDSFPAPHLV
jgi:hypothetical protein